MKPVQKIALGVAGITSLGIGAFNILLYSGLQQTTALNAMQMAG